MNERISTLIDDMIETMYQVGGGVGLAAPQVGILSLPGKAASVTRPNHVICRCLNRNMEQIDIEGEGLLARAICHETDHLDGILYKDVADEALKDVVRQEEKVTIN